jgi:HK97 family phage portal protein
VVVEGESPPWQPPPRIVASGWSGWPADWNTPNWWNTTQTPADTAWMCIDKTSRALSTMPPYLVDGAPTLAADWLNNPNPDLYVSWEEFCKRLVKDFMLGEVFVRATARYSTGWPSRFHVVPPLYVNVDRGGDGLRRYEIGGVDVTDDILHIRYDADIVDLHGHGPLEAGSARVMAAAALMEYGAKIMAGGGIPVGVLESQEEISPDQAMLIQQKWVERRMSSIGEPAVLDKGLQWKPSQLNPTDIGLVELERYQNSRICVLLGVPPEIVGLPGSGESMVYKNMGDLFDFWWRDSLKATAQTLMSALSGWCLPRGTRVELNRDEFVQPPPLARAQTYQILYAIQDPVTGQRAITVDEIRAAERLDNSTPADISSGVLK